MKFSKKKRTSKKYHRKTKKNTPSGLQTRYEIIQRKGSYLSNMEGEILSKGLRQQEEMI